MRRIRLLPLALAGVLVPPPASAQTGPALVGAGAGVLAGSVVSMGVIAARARAGSFVYSTDDFRAEYLWIPALALGGAGLGLSDGAHLETALEGAAVGLGVGAAVGAVLGGLAWGTEEGSWSGALIGGGTGVLVGAIVSAWRWDDDDRPGAGAVTLSLRLGAW